MTRRVARLPLHSGKAPRWLFTRMTKLAEIICQAPPARRDPTLGKGTRTRRWADCAYAHGGKDGTPFPVDRDAYDRNIAVLTDAVRKARLGENDQLDALRRLSRLEGPTSSPES